MAFHPDQGRENTLYFGAGRESSALLVAFPHWTALAGHFSVWQETILRVQPPARLNLLCNTVGLLRPLRQPLPEMMMGNQYTFVAFEKQAPCPPITAQWYKRPMALAPSGNSARDLR